MTKINLGSGDRYRNGYINVDNCQQNKVNCDLLANIKDINFNNNSIDEIYSSHLIAYLSKPELIHELNRWYNWLVPNGTLIIESGDLKLICKHIIKCIENNNIEAVDGLLGVSQLFGIEESSGHKWAYTEVNLTPLLKSAGFSDITFGPGEVACSELTNIRDFKMTAYKR